MKGETSFFDVAIFHFLLLAFVKAFHDRRAPWYQRGLIRKPLRKIGSFGRLSGSQPSAWFWAWSWDPLKFMRRHPPHHLSPARANHPAGQDPEARLSRPSHHSNAPIKPESQSILSKIVALTPSKGAFGKSFSASTALRCVSS